MHFVAEDQARVIVRNRRDLFSPATGERIGVLPTITMEPVRGSAPDWAVAEAVKLFNFERRPRPGAIGGEDIPVERWCVYVDTELWAQLGGHDDTIREELERRLGEDQNYKRVFPPKVVPPWPSYDELTVQGQRTAAKVAERNLETAEMTGVAIEDMIAYEEITLAREPVLVAYRRALAELEAQAVTAAPALTVDA